jgi:hypothetical protein
MFIKSAKAPLIADIGFDPLGLLFARGPIFGLLGTLYRSIFPHEKIAMFFVNRVVSKVRTLLV